MKEWWHLRKEWIRVCNRGQLAWTGLSSTLTFGHLSFSLRAMPLIVPPVPTPATSMSMLPAGTQPMCHDPETPHTPPQPDVILYVRVTVALLQDLLGRVVVVSQWVTGVAVLIQNVGVGDLILQAPGHTHVRLRRVKTGRARSPDDLSTKSMQHIHLSYMLETHCIRMHSCFITTFITKSRQRLWKLIWRKPNKPHPYPYKLVSFICIPKPNRLVYSMMK